MRKPPVECRRLSLVSSDMDATKQGTAALLCRRQKQEEPQQRPSDAANADGRDGGRLIAAPTVEGRLIVGHGDPAVPFLILILDEKVSSRIPCAAHTHIVLAHTVPSHAESDAPSAL